MRIYYVSIQGWQIAIYKHDSLGANSGTYVPIKGGVLTMKHYQTQLKL